MAAVLENPELEPDITELLDAGKSAQQIAQELVVPINDVLIVLERRRHAATPAAPKASPPSDRPRLAAVPVPAERAVTTTPPPPPNVDLISRGKACDVPKIRRLAERAESAMTALRSALDDHAAKAEARATVARLEAELAQARAVLKPSKSTDAAAPKPADTKAIRAWARENGHQVPDRGTLPAAVVDAYREAHPA